MYADVRDMVLRKEPFVTTCCTQYNLNDIAGKAYQVSLQKGGDSATPFHAEKSDHGHLEVSSSFTELSRSRTGPEVTCSSSSFEVCNNEQSAQHCAIMGAYSKKLTYNETYLYIFHLHLR